MTTPAVWNIGADQQSDAALADAREAIARAILNRVPAPSKINVMEDALRDIVSDAIALGGRHWEAPVRMAAEALARAGDGDSLLLVKKWAAL